MTIPETIVLVLVAAITSIATVVGGGIVGRAFGVGPLAKQSAETKSEIIDDLKLRLDLAEGDVNKANLEAEAARLASAETERRRQSCEDEIGRLKVDVRELERELIDLHRRTGKAIPKTLTDRELEHRNDAAAT